MTDNTVLLAKLEQLLKLKKSKAFYAERLKTSESEIEELMQKLKSSKKVPSEVTKEVNKEKGTITSTIEVSFEPKSDLELAELHKIDLSKYKISTYWTKLKSNGKFTSSVFASLKKPDDYTPEDFAKFLSSWKPKMEYGWELALMHSGKPTVDVELNISDFHLAKKTTKGDTPLTKSFEYYETVYNLVENVRNNYSIKKLVFPISNDFFHSDNSQNTTTNGTPQDVTAWYDEEYEKGFDILANAINFLVTQAEEVEVVLVQGNHDRTKGFY